MIKRMIIPNNFCIEGKLIFNIYYINYEKAYREKFLVKIIKKQNTGRKNGKANCKGHFLFRPTI